MFLPRRLDKFIRDSTELSLKNVRIALQEGQVHVEGHPPCGAPLSGQIHVFEDDVVCMNGKRLQPRSLSHTLVLNKPRSVTSTSRDPKGKQDLSAWLKRMPAGVFPVGRLDRETTGALLFTDDGDLASAILGPEHSTEKTYWLWLNETIALGDPRLLHWTEGMTLSGEKLRGAQVEVLSTTPDMTELLVVLKEGKNRQIRRMCRAADFRLLHLHRRSVATVTVEGLELGSYRALTKKEVELLWANLGGRSIIRQYQRSALIRHAREAREKGTPHHRLERWLEATPHMLEES